MTRILLIISTTAALALARPAWELKKDSEGIRVFVSEVQGSKFKQFKVETEIHADAQKISRIIADVENNHAWINNVEQARIIEHRSDAEFIFTQVYRTPFPFSDRVMAAKCAINKLPGGAIRIEMIEDIAALKTKNKKLIVFPVSRGHWHLVPKDGKTHMEYSFRVEPGGRIPAWMANMFLVDAPFETTRNLKEIVASGE